MNMEWEQEKPRDNVLTGTVGAFLGSLIGVACIVLVDRFGYVSTVGGMVMAVCAMKGYALLGGRFSKRGAVISSLMILVMTYIANKICFALEVTKLVSEEGVSFFEVYQNLHLLLTDGEFKRVYLGSLVMLYLFTLVGGIPTVITGLREPARRPAGSEPAQAQEDPPELQGEFYALRKDWMRPLRLSILVPVLVIMAAGFAGFLAAGFIQVSRLLTAIMAGCFLSSVILFFMSVPTIKLCNAPQILYVRAGNRLWQVDLQKFCNVMDWEKQTPSRQSAIRCDVLQEIERLLDGREPSYGTGALVELADLQVEKEDQWSWTVSYETETGKRKKVKIGKGYPDFCPVSGMERAQGAVPSRWPAVLLSVIFAVVAVGAFWAMDLPLEFVGGGGGQVLNRDEDAKIEANTTPEPEVKRIPARVPKTFTEFEMSEVWFCLDGDFQYSRRTFLDGQTGTSYRAYVQYGVDESDAWDTLTQYISEYRISPLYNAVYLDTEPLISLSGTLKYNIVSVYLTDGHVFHTAAVLSDSGTLFTMEAKHDSSVQSVEEVLANLMFILESVRFEGPELTEENYQSQIHISEVRNCIYMAAAYIKTDHFGHDAFVDVYVPYSDTPIYSADGRSIRTESHGLRVYATILPGKNAKDVVEARYQELAATGQVYEEGVADEEYREDLDAACKMTSYQENGQDRYAVLYADSKWDGYYLLREITGLPELVDEEYPALLAELESIIGLTMPALEDLGN